MKKTTIWNCIFYGVLIGILTFSIFQKSSFEKTVNKHLCKAGDIPHDWGEWSVKDGWSVKRYCQRCGECDYYVSRKRRPDVVVPNEEDFSLRPYGSTNFYSDGGIIMIIEPTNTAIVADGDVSVKGSVMAKEFIAEGKSWWQVWK